jgi:hypothetical protein
MYRQPVIWSTWALEIISSESWAENEIQRHGQERQQAFMGSGLNAATIEQLNR